MLLEWGQGRTVSWLMRRSDSASSSRGRASDTFMLRFSVLERPPVMALFTLKQTCFCHIVIVNAADNSPSRSYTKVVMHAFEPGVRSAMLCMLKSSVGVGCIHPIQCTGMQAGRAAGGVMQPTKHIRATQCKPNTCHREKVSASHPLRFLGVTMS